MWAFATAGIKNLILIENLEIVFLEGIPQCLLCWLAYIKHSLKVRETR